MPFLHFLKTKITGCNPQPVDYSVISNFFDSMFGADWPWAHLNFLVVPTVFLVGVSIVIRHWVLQEQTSLPWSFATFFLKFGSWFYGIRMLKLLVVDVYKLNPYSEG